MEISRISSKGQVTIPKSIREALNVSEGDRVAFIQDEGKVIITKASLLALRELQDALSKDAREQGISEQDVLDELERVRGGGGNFGMSGKGNKGFRVFIDTNVLISAILSETSISAKLLRYVIEEHELLICSFTLTETSKVLERKFPARLLLWDRFLLHWNLS